MTPLAKSVLWISLALWTRRASPRDGVGTREHAWSRDSSGDCLPNGARDPLGVRESRDLLTVTCSLGLGAESWVCNNCQLANYFRIPVFLACCKAIREQPREDLPFGLIRYSFEQSLARIFNGYDNVTKAAFIGTLVLFESLDFLDGHILNTYGYLNFGADNSYFLQDPGYHCEDIIRLHPGLLRYCLTP